MKNVVFIMSVFLFISLSSFSPISGEEKDPLALPYEARLNKRQPPDKVLKAIGIKPGMIIGEVGAGRGRYTVEIASRIGPSGRLYANDIRGDALKYLKRRCAGRGFNNVEIILGSVTKTNLPTGALDMVIMVNVVHCLEKPVELLKNIADSLKPHGLIVIVEGNLDKAPSAAGEWYARSKLLKIYKDAGYVLVREETFLPKDNIYFLKWNK
jgi:ubiquinone/menaquinone biosynthesis C-methylase UbiE